MSQDAVSRAEFEALRAEVASLRAALAAMKKEAGVPDDHLHLIAAAVAVYLGKRATIRYIRRSGDASDSWRSQGRASISASHQLPRVKGW